MSISKRLKWVLFGLGFFSTNGLVIPTLSNNLFSSSGVSISDFALGGAFSNLIDFSKEEESINKTKLDLQKPQVQKTNLDIFRANSSEQVEWNLETFNSDSINLVPLFALAESQEDIKNSITEIYSAIKVEDTVKEIESRVQKKYSYLLSTKLDSSESKREAHLRKFTDAKAILQPKQSRNRRSINSSTSISQSHRDSIGKIYSLYINLKRASRELALEFRREFPEVDLLIALPQSNGISSGNIERALRIIRWFDKNIKTQKEQRNTKFFKFDSWGPWNVNPFKPFYNDEQEFRKDIQALQKNASSVYKLEQELLRDQAQVNRFWTPSLKKKLQQQFEDKKRAVAELSASTDSHIVERVASFLLKAMGQT